MPILGRIETQSQEDQMRVRQQTLCPVHGATDIKVGDVCMTETYNWIVLVNKINDNVATCEILKRTDTHGDIDVSPIGHWFLCDLSPIK